MFAVFIDGRDDPLGFSSSYDFCESMGKRFSSNCFDIVPFWVEYEKIPVDKIMEPG